MQSESRSNPSVNAHESFFRGWYSRLEDLFGEFESAESRIVEHFSDDNVAGGGFKELIVRALGHYEQYFIESWRISHQNVFLLFSPPWLSRFERALLWIAGFKPVLFFRIISDFIHDLSPDQSNQIQRVMEETKIMERALSEELAKFQESIGSRPVVELARGDGRWVTNEIVVMERLQSAAQVLVAGADFLREKVGREVIGILSPTQGVRFLRAAMKMQLQVRSLGMQRDGGNTG